MLSARKQEREAKAKAKAEADALEQARLQPLTTAMRNKGFLPDQNLIHSDGTKFTLKLAKAYLTSEGVPKSKVNKVKRTTVILMIINSYLIIILRTLCLLISGHLQRRDWVNRS